MPVTGPEGGQRSPHRQITPPEVGWHGLQALRSQTLTWPSLGRWHSICSSSEQGQEAQQPRQVCVDCRHRSTGGLWLLVLSCLNFQRQLGAARLSHGFAACCSPRGASALILLPSPTGSHYRKANHGDTPVGWFPTAPPVPPLPGTEEHRGLPPTL